MLSRYSGEQCAKGSITIVMIYQLTILVSFVACVSYLRVRGNFSNMVDHVTDFLLEKTLGWPSGVAINKVDTHHHYVPSFYAKAVEDAGGDPSGWPTPPWTPLRSELLMKHMGIQTAILSVTAPGACILEGQASYALARKLNESGAELRDKNPQKFGFFASLPSLLDTDAALAEIRYALDVLHADGVTLFTRYGIGNNYLGHADIEPIWAELNRRKCVVFVHPTHPVDTNKVNEKLPQPVIDYPHETTRTAMDMILMGTRRKFPDCKVILSHAGGSLPYLISRLATPLRATPNFAATAAMGTNHDQAMASFRSFHYDLALSASPQVLDILLKLVPHDHILFGSDFPYAPPPAYPGFLGDFEKYPLDKEKRDMVNFGNAHALFPRLAESTSSI